jgi:hypothetical protein
MRIKRAIVLAAMLAFVLLTVTLSIMAMPSGSEEPVIASQGGSQPVPAAPSLAEGAGSPSQAESAPSGVPALVLWIGAVVSGSGVVVTFAVLRVEVTKEKAAIRAKKNRADYYKDLKKYNAQLKGPPRDNT